MSACATSVSNLGVGVEEENMSSLAEIINQSVCKTGLFVSASSTAMKGALIT